MRRCAPEASRSTQRSPAEAARGTCSSTPITAGQITRISSIVNPAKLTTSGQSQTSQRS
jgi:hypothetical protein